MNPSEDSGAVDDLLDQLAICEATDPRRSAIREAVIVAYQPLVRALASRYAGRGESLDDLVQAGSIGLINAVDRFDPQQREAFTRFVATTVLGEIRRHFRDTTWAMRVPRRLQDLSREVTSARSELQQRLGRSPTVAEVAVAAGLTTQEVVDALLAGQAHYTSTLEPEVITSTASEDGDDPLARVLDRFDLSPALAIVSDLDRQLLIMRFVDERSQSDIAEALGMDQSTVSRRIARTLVELRAYLSADSELAESRWGTNSPQSAATAGTSSTQP